MNWQPGNRVTHRLNPELGLGRILKVEGRFVIAHFPIDDATLRIAADNDALLPWELTPGTRVRHLPSQVDSVVALMPSEERAILADGLEVDVEDLWPIVFDLDLGERIGRGQIDSLDAFKLRLDLLRLAKIREASGLGSFLGGRIRLFPHQLHVAERATQTDPVRWLLADEVGLGKTVESCLILNHLLRTGRVDSAMVVAPETLTVQWLGELYRKYHQVFVLLDDKRLQDVERDYGKNFNPFDAYSRVVVSRERLESSPRLSEMAVAAGMDLVVVDEAHHLRRPLGHPGNAAYRAIAPLTDQGRHVLLLTAVPLEDDAHGFLRLLQLLLPAEFPDDESLEARLQKHRRLPPCTSATRRADIGGLPPRVGKPVEMSVEELAATDALVSELRRMPDSNALEKRRKADAIRQALASPSAFAQALQPSASDELRELARTAGDADPRMHWLREQAREWQKRGEKTLVFVAERDALEAVREALSGRVKTGVFHEDLSPRQRDIEVAQFRISSGPSLLVSTECGGEGRNFEFCHRVVLYDLPWNPMTVEQRIGRLDRIGRQWPVEIRYFRPQHGIDAAVAMLYEKLQIFERPLGSIETQLRGVEAAIRDFAISGSNERMNDPAATTEEFSSLIEQARLAYDRVEAAASHELHREPFRADMADEILSRVPEDLEELTERVVLAASRQLHMRVEEQARASRYWIELGSKAKVDSLPGVPSDEGYLGSFTRSVAVDDETIEFFASGHPLVEGLLAHLEDDLLGRTAVLHLEQEDTERYFAMLGVYRSGANMDAVAVDMHGQRRDDLAERMLEHPCPARSVRLGDWVEKSSWKKLVQTLSGHLARHSGHRSAPVALAVFRVG